MTKSDTILNIICRLTGLLNMLIDSIEHGEDRAPIILSRRLDKAKEAVEVYSMTTEAEDAKTEKSLTESYAMIEVLLDQYKQVCEDNNVRGWPSMVQECESFLSQMVNKKKKGKKL